MALNIFEQYGIKEVANVYFEALEADSLANVAVGDIVLYLDTLKVSTIETTAENTEATGGWGNPSLIMWDFGKEINITLEDALISMESLRFMLGGAIKEATAEDKVTTRRTAEGITVSANNVPTLKDPLTGANLTLPTTYRYINLTTGKRGTVTGGTGLNIAANDRVRYFWTEERDGTTGNEAVQVTISPSTFPGTYRVIGDTLIRNTNGKDSAFQFVIDKAKVNSEVTITLEAKTFGLFKLCELLETVAA